MEGKKIHIIEDEDDIVELIQFNLVRSGFQVACFTSGESGLAAVRAEHPDLVLLDLMLPGIDGLEICRTLKALPETQDIPIIMVTAKGEERDIVKGLEHGADDYITKPFSPSVLIARVKSVLRRTGVVESSEEIIDIHDIRVHPGRHEVKVHGKRIDLTSSEFKILHFLSQKPGWVFTRSQIVDAIRGDNYAVTDRSIDVQIVGLRKKLNPMGEAIETVRGVGYRFKELTQ